MGRKKGVLDRRQIGQHEKIVTRRIEALELRKHGATFRQVAAALHVSLGTAYEDVQAELAEAVRLKNKKADQLSELELQRLDRLLLVLNKAIEAGDPKAVAQAIKIATRRARLLGLDAPTKIAPTDPTRTQEWEPLTDAETVRRLKALLKEFDGRGRKRA